MSYLHFSFGLLIDQSLIIFLTELSRLRVILIYFCLVPRGQTEIGAARAALLSLEKGGGGSLANGSSWARGAARAARI